MLAASAGKLGVRVTRASVKPKWPELRTPKPSSARPPSRSQPASLADRARQAWAWSVRASLFIRELNRGDGALPLPAAEFQLPSVALQNPLHDSQPQSAAFGSARIRSAIKFLEDLWQIFRWDSHTRISHFHVNGSAIFQSADLDRLFRGRELEGVLDEIV